jgi:hypothetical protein
MKVRSEPKPINTVMKLIFVLWNEPLWFSLPSLIKGTHYIYDKWVIHFCLYIWFNLTKRKHSQLTRNSVWTKRPYSPIHLSTFAGHEGGEVVSHMHRPPSHPEDTPSTNLCQKLSQRQGHSMARRIMSMKKPNDPNGIRISATCRLVAQWLNQLRHGLYE